MVLRVFVKSRRLVILSEVSLSRASPLMLRLTGYVPRESSASGSYVLVYYRPSLPFCASITASEYKRYCPKLGAKEVPER